MGPDRRRRVVVTGLGCVTPLGADAASTWDAAVAGQGVALVRSALAATHMIAGRLVRPFDLSLPVPYAYYIVCPRPRADRPKIRLFRDWLLAEAAADAETLKALEIFPGAPEGAAAPNAA